MSEAKLPRGECPVRVSPGFAHAANLGKAGCDRNILNVRRRLAQDRSRRSGEGSSLYFPLRRKTLQRPCQRHLRPLLPVQDGLDNIGREQRQPQDAGHV